MAGIGGNRRKDGVAADKGRRPRRIQRGMGPWPFRVLVYGFLLVVAIYILFPFAWMLSTALKTEAEALAIPPTWIPRELTLDSVIGIWVRKNFGIYFFNSTVISLATAVLSVLFGALAGYGFSRFHFPGRQTLIGFFLATQMLPGVLLVGPYFKVLNAVGLYDTRTGLVIAFLTICLPFATWTMKGFIDGADGESMSRQGIAPVFNKQLWQPLGLGHTHILSTGHFVDFTRNLVADRSQFLQIRTEDFHNSITFGA